MLDNSQIPRMIRDALATEQNKPKQIIGGMNRMSMNNPYANNNQPNQGNMALQKVPASFNVYDPNTGRNWTEDANGKRIMNRRPMTATQLVAINNMRAQLGIKHNVTPKMYLTDHNVSQMSVDSASIMIEDLRYWIEQYRIIGDEKMKLVEHYENQLIALNEQLENVLKDPKVGAQIALMRQAESTKNSK